MTAWRRPIDLLEKWSIGPFWTAFIGLFILQFGDKGQFIIAATAARTDMWLLAAIGGWIGVIAACVPALLLQERLAQLLPLVRIRLIGGIIFISIGILLALSAWGLF